VGRGQARLAAFRVSRCQNGDHSVTDPASGIPGRTEQVDLDRLGAGRKIGSTGADSADLVRKRSRRSARGSALLATGALSAQINNSGTLGKVRKSPKSGAKTIPPTALWDGSRVTGPC